MKKILLLIMLTTMLFSNEKQIIVGSYLKENNALNSILKLNKHILNDDKLSTLISKNSIEVELKKIGKYNAISLSPFTSYVQLLRTLRALENYYDDAYVLDNGQKININQVIVQEIFEKKILPAKLKIKEPTKLVKEVKVKKAVKKVAAKEDESLEVKIKKEVKAPAKYVQEEKDYILEIVLALLVILGVGYIIYKTSKQRKKETKEDENL